MQDSLMLLVALVAVALIFDFLNGLHDAANSIATVVSTRVLSPNIAVVWAAFFNFIAFLFFGLHVAQTVGTGIISPDIVDGQVIFGALMGAIVWNLLTWWGAIPSSSSHALIGGLIGAGAAKAGFSAVVCWGTLKTVAAIVWSPLLGFALEGIICLAMAAPLALPFAIAGGLVARSILKGSGSPHTAPGAFTACVALLPVMMFGERAAKMEPPVNAVTTSIVIDAPVDVVWRNVIAFPPLAPPEEAIFRAGVAYPITGQIVGSGVGAVRYCRFSTGDFVEPITTWDEDRLLAFNVVAQPQSLRELSPWEIVPPHIEKNYMRSQHGQFRLTVLDAHTTLLEGTTWYQNYLWPQQYWREWSDGIVHRIHLRVLRHVKAQAEMAVATTAR